MAKRDEDRNLTADQDSQTGYTEFGSEEGMADDPAIHHDIQKGQGDQKVIDPSLTEEEDEDLDTTM